MNCRTRSWSDIYCQVDSHTPFILHAFKDYACIKGLCEPRHKWGVAEIQYGVLIVFVVITDVHWRGKGPMFFYTGNEGPIESFYNNTGFLFELAQNFSALIVFAEHVSCKFCLLVLHTKVNPWGSTFLLCLSHTYSCMNSGSLRVSVSKIHLTG